MATRGDADDENGARPTLGWESADAGTPPAGIAADVPGPEERRRRRPGALLRGLRRGVRATVLGGLLAATVVATSGDALLRPVLLEWLGAAPPVLQPARPLEALFELTPLSLTLNEGWRALPAFTTPDQLLRDATLWRRMQLQNWDLVPPPLRERCLAAMLARFEDRLAGPRVWETLGAAGWDLVPQPVRALAFLRMLDHWSRSYSLGELHGLALGEAADLVAAVVMAESWFEHRAVNDSHPEHRDLGLAQATDYVRAALPRLLRARRVDYAPESDEEYFDPWTGTRVAVLWFGLMLDEAGGDPELAVRAYHRGIEAARRGEGQEYLEGVERRLALYVRGEADSQTWRWLRSRWRPPAGKPAADPWVPPPADPWVAPRDHVGP